MVHRPSTPSDRRSTAGWISEAVDWLTAMGADVDAQNEAYRQALALPQNSYLREQARMIGATGSAAGMQALGSGRTFLSRGNRHPVNLSGFDWQRPSVHDRSQLWALQQWLPVRDCLYERNVGSTATLDILVPWLRDWVATYTAPEGIRQHQHLSWHDHATARRAISAVYYILILADAGMPLPEVFPRLYEFIGIHMVVLRSDSFYSARTNHGFDQALALYLLASAFEMGDLSRECRRVARQRLLEEMAVAFSDEGVHIENSPAYHPLMLNRMLQARSLLAGFDDTPSDLDIDGIYNRGVEFLAYATRPNGKLPQFGDTDDAVLRFEPDAAIAPDTSPLLRYSLSGGAEGLCPLHSIRIFPRSGYAFLRNNWGRSGTFEQIFYLAIKSGFLNTYHRHDDDNNFVLFAHGEDWLIDGGIYKYQEDDEFRIYLRSSLAHNIVTPLGVPVSRTIPPVGSGNGFRRWRTVNGVTELHIRSLMYEGLIYDRTLRLDRRAETIELEDRIAGADKTPRDYEFRLHFPLERTLSVVPGGALRVVSHKSKRCLIVEPQGQQFDSVTTHTGRAEPPLAGWTSPTLGELTEAHTAVFSQLGRPNYESRVQIRFEAR